MKTKIKHSLAILVSIASIPLIVLAVSSIFLVACLMGLVGMIVNLGN